MRPRGEIRAALAAAAERLLAQPGLQAVGLTYVDLAQAACVGFKAAQRTLDNMSRAGEFVRVGSRPVPGAKRPVSTYVPARLAQRAA